MRVAFHNLHGMTYWLRRFRRDQRGAREPEYEYELVSDRGESTDLEPDKAEMFAKAFGGKVEP